MEEGLVAHVPLYGDFFRCARRLDAPEHRLPDQPAAGSAVVHRAAAGQRRRTGRPTASSCARLPTMARSGASAGDKRPKRMVTEAEIRGTCNRLIVSGVNAITSYYSFTDLRRRSAAAA